MSDLSQQDTSATAGGAKAAPIYGFYAIAPSTADAGRVILGGGFASVPENNKNKVRGCAAKNAGFHPDHGKACVS